MPNRAVTDVQWSGNYASGRPEGDPTSITIHHWGDDGQDHQTVVNWLCREDGDTSAHYVVSAGRVTQIVHDYDRAWHAGRAGNPRSIGIECRPEMTQGDVQTLVGLISAIKEEWGDLDIVGHKDWMSTACPGRYYGILPQLRAVSPGSSPAVRVPSGTAPSDHGPLAVDGVLGPLTMARWQSVYTTPVDGVMSGQTEEISARWTTSLPGVIATEGDGESAFVRSLQSRLGVAVDGYAGAETITALQRSVGVAADGWAGAQTISAVQSWINRTVG